ncbi:ATPase AAA [Ottowia thiooxydans]|uniref:ATPase AAA n=1 Tax=Ottowia thiooxydans TaxID=219182 RepID=UPI0004903955|nr:ATPase AAA [Ottowia thiooxydans]
MDSLHDLGSRICILGPSNSGKSTLAEAIARKRGLPAIHLDQLFHQPHTDWQPRPQAEFIRLHDQAIEQHQWVMEGNYTRTLDQRLERATGFILLEVSTAISLFRYFRRTWFEHHRPGALEGGKDSIKWGMLRHIAIVTPGNRLRYAELYEKARLPKVKLATTGELNRFYQAEQLGAYTRA